MNEWAGRDGLGSNLDLVSDLEPSQTGRRRGSRFGSFPHLYRAYVGPTVEGHDAAALLVERPDPCDPVVPAAG